ncbi:MmgE/PrpD family protein [Chloroflexota bacterium]
MTFKRDLGWQNLELTYRSSIASQFARYALGLNYEMLPPDVVYQAKRCLLDTLGCAIGAYEAPGRPMVEEFVKELGGPEEATVFGSGRRTSAPNATLVNSFMVRFLDYNDIEHWGHCSDTIPSILAVSEREKASGCDFLTSLVISYELRGRVGESVSPTVWHQNGWVRESICGLTMPPTLGRLMVLNEEQIANAIGICASGSIPLGILDAAGEEFTMRKNLRMGFVAHDAILSCMLAKTGFTGPIRVVEGEDGMNQVMFQGKMDFERMTDFSGWRILRTNFKALCANNANHGHLYATLAIVKEHDLKPDDIAAVHITRRQPRKCTFACKYPRNAESADHSSIWTTAIAIKERWVGPDSIKPKNFTDPVVLDLIEKITEETDPSMALEAGKSEIVTKDGRRFQQHNTTFHGKGDDPLTDEELEHKFREMAIKCMSEKQIRQIFDAVLNVEKLDNMGKLMKLMIF